MPTTIDNIQIEIQSNSAGASQGIQAVTAALEGLKKNGDVSGAVTNLTNLGRAMKSIADGKSASGKINALVKSLGQLKGTNLGNVSNLSSQLSAISSAASGLSGIKSSGLSSMVNALSRLSDVAKKLDDKTIDDFADKVKKLTNALGPLSTKLSTVSMGLKNVNAAAGKAGHGIKTSSMNFFTFSQNLESVVQVLIRVAKALADVIAQAIEWDGIAARFGRGFGPQAQETYEWVQRLNEEMGINAQQFMQYSSVYATMLTGFGVAQADAAKMALGYTELTYDIWAGYNDIYKSYADAADAVKSAIAGEVEPIRRAGFTIVESTLEQTAANHGLEISLEKATEAQKSYLRYLTLVDQAHSQNLVGTYARELNTAEGVMRTFSQQLKSLAQAFGSLFLPVLVKVMPWVQAFVELLTDAVKVVAGFFGIEIQPIDWGGYGSGISGATDTTEGLADANNSLADSADKAAKATKALKNATIGIDELNVISPPDPNTGSAGSGAGGSGVGGVGGAGFDGLDVDSLWDESIFDGIQSRVDELKGKIKEMLLDLAPILAGIAAAIAGWKLSHFLDDLDNAGIKLGKLKGALEVLSKVLIIGGISIAVGKLVWDFTGTYLDTGSFKDLAKALGTTVLGTAVAAWLTGKVGAGIVMAVSGIVTLTRLGVELAEGSVEITDPQALITMLVGALETALGGFLIVDAIKGGAWSKAIGGAIWGGLKAAVGVINWSGIASAVGSALSTALGAVGTVLGGLTGWAWAAIAAVVATLILAVVDYDFTEVGYKVGQFLGKALGKVGEWLGGVGDWVVGIGKAIWGGIQAAFEWVKKNFTLEKITELLGKIFSVEFWTDTVWPKMLEIGKNIIDGLWSGITGCFKNLIGNITEFINGFVQGWKDGLGVASPSKVFKTIGGQLIDGLWLGITGMFATLIQNVRTFVSNAIAKVKEFFGISGKTSSKFSDIGGNLVQGIIDGITGKATSLWNSLKGWAEGIIKNVKGLFGIHSPSTAFKSIGSDCVAGLVQPFSLDTLTKPIRNAWNNAREWWNEKKGSMATYTPSIGSIASKVSGAWSSAKTWWNEKKGSLKSYTPSIGSIYEPLAQRWSNAREWWNEKKTKLKTYTPSIGSIYEPLSERWKNAKNWWNKSKGKLSFTPSVGSITSSLKSAWSSAKKWWKNNVKLSIPSLSLTVSYSKASGWKKAVANALDLPGWPKLKFAANGGMFDMGSLIWAGERGAEIVANAHGGQTGVMNIEQMHQAVYEATYAAMMAAMQQASKGGEQAVNVYLDGRQITSAVERRQKDRGRTVMGTQVYSY